MLFYYYCFFFFSFNKQKKSQCYEQWEIIFLAYFLRQIFILLPNIENWWKKGNILYFALNSMSKQKYQMMEPEKWLEPCSHSVMRAPPLWRKVDEYRTHLFV